MKFKIFLFLTLITLAFPKDISAHVLKTDGPIGAVVHIDPDDDPIIGEPASFFFEFKDTEGNFRTEDCNCTATISNEEEVLTTQPLTSSASLESSSFYFTFTEKGVYTIKVDGKPLEDGKFEPFELTYDLRVERTSSNQNSNEGFISENFHFLALGTIFFIAAFIFILGQRKTKKTNLKGSGLSCLILLLSFLFLFQHLQVHNLVPKHHIDNEITAQETHLPCCLPSSINFEFSYVSVKPTFDNLKFASFKAQGFNLNWLDPSKTRSPPLV